ncbi:hypothetical protein M3J09_000957 [Ascochyta lentis]
MRSSQVASLLLSLASFPISSNALEGKPALILVPGTFHRASVYDEVKSQLEDVGYEHVNAIDLPSNGYDAADVERTADVAVVTKMLESMLEDGEDVILVGNSYGATVIMEAVKDFEDWSAVSAGGKIDREGRILGLIMVSTYLPRVSHTRSICDTTKLITSALGIYSHHRRSQPQPSPSRHTYHRRPLLQLPRLSQRHAYAGNMGQGSRHLPALSDFLQPPQCIRSRLLGFSTVASEFQSTQRYGDLHSLRRQL